MFSNLSRLQEVIYKKREVRSISKDNNIFSFSEFKKSYQNETYSQENVHGFKNKVNEKISIKNNSNSNFNYMENENNSGIKFKPINSDEIEVDYDIVQKMRKQYFNNDEECNINCDIIVENIKIIYIIK